MRRISTYFLFSLAFVATPALAETPAPFTDKDEGSTGALQDAHDGEVVFGNAVIPRKNADPKLLVTRTTLAKPLYVRAFMKKTPARVLHEAKIHCEEDQHEGWFVARIKGSAKEADLSERALGDLFYDLRSVALTAPKSGGPIVSLIPTAPFFVKDEQTPELTAMASVLAGLKPGDNVIEVDYMVGCAAHGAEGRHRVSAAKGSVTLTVASGQRQVREGRRPARAAGRPRQHQGLPRALLQAAGERRQGPGLRRRRHRRRAPAKEGDHAAVHPPQRG
jgi:hypothetical protein